MAVPSLVDAITQAWFKTHSEALPMALIQCMDECGCSDDVLLSPDLVERICTIIGIDITKIAFDTVAQGTDHEDAASASGTHPSAVEEAETENTPSSDGLDATTVSPSSHSSELADLGDDARLSTEHAAAPHADSGHFSLSSSLDIDFVSATSPSIGMPTIYPDEDGSSDVYDTNTFGYAHANGVAALDGGGVSPDHVDNNHFDLYSRPSSYTDSIPLLSSSRLDVYSMATTSHLTDDVSIHGSMGLSPDPAHDTDILGDVYGDGITAAVDDGGTLPDLLEISMQAPHSDSSFFRTYESFERCFANHQKNSPFERAVDPRKLSDPAGDAFTGIYDTDSDEDEEETAAAEAEDADSPADEDEEALVAEDEDAISSADEARYATDEDDAADEDEDTPTGTDDDATDTDDAVETSTDQGEEPFTDEDEDKPTNTDDGSPFDPHRVSREAASSVRPSRKRHLTEESDDAEERKERPSPKRRKIANDPEAPQASRRPKKSEAEVLAERTCGKCNHTFTRKYDLQRHQREKDCGDQAPERFKCSIEGCDSTFSRPENVERHEKTAKIHKKKGPAGEQKGTRKQGRGNGD